jgi:drug/metabolite transporter (DMT)-like permease
MRPAAAKAAAGIESPMRTRDIVPILALFAAMLLWAGSFIALKIAFTAYHPMIVIFARMAIAALAFVPFAGLMRPNAARLDDIPLILFMLACEPCLYFLFESAALVNTSASQAGMITAMLPVMVALGAGVFLGERIGARTVAGFTMAVAGACLLSMGGGADSASPSPALGNFFEFCAMMCATGYTLSLKRLSERYSPLFLTALQACAGSVFYLPLVFLPTTEWPKGLHLGAALSVLYLGLFVTMGAYGLYNFAVSRVKAVQASAFVNLIPVFTVLMGRVLLGERLTALQYAASFVVILGVVLSQDLPGGDGAGASRAR